MDKKREKMKQRDQDIKICKWELRFKMFYKRLLSDWKNERIISEFLHFIELGRAEA